MSGHPREAVGGGDRCRLVTKGVVAHSVLVDGATDKGEVASAEHSEQVLRPGLSQLLGNGLHGLHAARPEKARSTSRPGDVLDDVIVLLRKWDVRRLTGAAA
jgi:hypothetical protein